MNPIAEAVYYGDISYNMGAAAENAVAEAILKSGLPARYYRKTGVEDRMELNFLIERGRSMVATGVYICSPTLADSGRRTCSRAITGWRTAPSSHAHSSTRSYQNARWISETIRAT